MKKNITRSFVIVFSAIIAVFILAICLFLRLFNSALQKQMLSHCQMILDSDSLYIDTVTRAVKDVFDSMSFDVQVSKLLNYEAITSGDLNQGLQRLDSYVNSNFYIDSIYIYNRSNGNIYVSSPNGRESVYTEDSFFDDDALNIMKDYSGYSNMQPLFREVCFDYPYDTEINFISFLRFNTLKKDGSSDVIMINVRQEIFSALLEELPENDSRLLVFSVDPDSYITVAGKEYRYSPQAISILLDDLENKNNSGLSEVDGSGYIVCAQPVMNGYVDLVLIASESDIDSVMQDRVWIFAMLAVLSALTACVFAAWTVIRKLIRFSQLHRDSIARLEREKADMAREQERTRLLSFLEGKTEEQVQISESVVLVMLYLNEYHTRISAEYERIKDRNILKKNIIESVSEKSDIPVLFSTYDDDKCFICIKSTGTPDLSENLSSAVMFIKDKYNVDITAIISREDDYSSLPVLFDELCEALPYRVIMEKGTIITTSMCDARNMCECVLPEDLLKTLSQNILRLNTNESILILKEIIDEISSGSYRSFQICIMQLAITLDDILTRLQLNNGIEKTVNIVSLIYSLSSFNSLDEIYSAFVCQIREVETLVENNKNNHQKNMIDEVRKITGENYNCKTFSIISIADEMNMNASYLGKLFKKNTGQTFVEYLHCVRMEKACELLRKTDMEINSIVDAVGYSDITYFYKVFRKMNGCTPLVYRQSKKENNL